MAKRRYDFDEDKLARFLKEGRGQGMGSSYKPWLTIHDVPSQGRVARIPGVKTGRLHHLLSDHESAAFFLLDWSDNVLDIREQFPLDREVTRRIAGEMGVRHPSDVRTKSDIVMTTDLVVDMRTAEGTKIVAFSVKPSADLDSVRTLEKLEIERRYWLTQGTEWAIVTERDMCKVRVDNIRWAREFHSMEGLVVPYADFWQDRCSRFLGALDQWPNMTIKQFLEWLESSQGFGSGEAMTAIRHLIATKTLIIDMDRPFDTSARLSQAISLCHVQGGRRRA